MFIFAGLYSHEEGLTSLKKLKNILPQSQLSNIYRDLVESHMRYADVIKSSLSKSRKESLQCLQDRAISMIRVSSHTLRYGSCEEQINEISEGSILFHIFYISYFKHIYTGYKFNKYIVLQFGPVKGNRHRYIP